MPITFIVDSKNLRVETSHDGKDISDVGQPEELKKIMQTAPGDMTHADIDRVLMLGIMTGAMQDGWVPDEPIELEGGGLSCTCRSPLETLRELEKRNEEHEQKERGAAWK